jgi:carbamoyltransferase
MAIFGISCGFHDAAVSVVSGKKILFAGHSERYSKTKNDPLLHKDLVREALEWGDPDTIVYYERPWLKRTRQWYAGQTNQFDYKAHIRDFFGKVPVEKVGHHEAHAAAGYYTSGFDDAAIIVVDAIGEWDTTSVWVGSGDVLKKVWSTTYPDSLGLLYSAFTKRCGFKPNEEEYIMMGAAAYGRWSTWHDFLKTDFIEYGDGPDFRLRQNVHFGIDNWKPSANIEDLAAGMQSVLEEYLVRLFEWVAFTTGKRYVVFMGGVALNCVANAKLAARHIFDDIWIMPNPGDSGSSLGAALACKREQVQWDGPYLGTDIKREVDIANTVAALGEGKICAIAAGRAEFGPRALGNRSILADPRSRRTKNHVNEIKKRQKFRPFAASILEEHAHDWFTMPEQVAISPYMQYSWCVRYPRAVPAICHVDATSRIQTVNREQNPMFYDLLTRWFEKTGCPMLLNTSLNVKGMPLVNDWQDAELFRASHDIPIF